MGLDYWLVDNSVISKEKLLRDLRYLYQVQLVYLPIWFIKAI